MTPLEQTLRRTIKGEVLFDKASRGRYSTDASIYQIEPVGVVVPRDETDLALALDVARDAKAAILPRGAGTSQCGQTVGAALIVDFSKYMREVVGFDKQRAEVTVQPGVVLDQLNAWLKPHGLWYPVDVSTSAQCTLGGMAGNNSCGSRSIRYGNMVHNVAAIDAILADGRRARFDSKRPEDMQPAVRAIADKVAALAIAEQDEIARMYPKVLRRVGGYNLDIFFPQSERPYTTDNSVNLAHLLVGSEGTLAVTERLTLKLSRLPKHKTLGVVNFPSFYKAMDSAQHIVKLKPTAVELVDRTMIELARANPAFRPVIERALIGKPEAILLVEFAGDEREAQLRDLARLVELMADLGMPGSVVEMPEPGPQSALWEVRKAGLNIMMSMKGDGKPVSFIEDCAVPLEHLADYTQRLTDVFAKHGTRGTWYAHASVGTLHVRPILDMRREGADQDARHRRGGVGHRARIQGRLFGRARRRAGALGVGGLAVRAAHHQGLRGDQGAVRSRRPAQSRQDRAADQDGRPLAVPLQAGLRGDRLQAGARLVGVERAERSHHRDVDRTGQRRRSQRRLRQGRRDVQQQRPLPEVRRRHDVPVLPRDARRGASDARPRQHAAPRPVRPARRGGAHLRHGRQGAGSLRQLQGLQARLPDRRRHGAHEDRGEVGAAHEQGLEPARPADRRSAGDGALGAAPAVAVQSRGPRAALARLRQAARIAQMAQRHVPGDDRCRCQATPRS